jgi:signal transduction histidine kinase
MAKSGQTIRKQAGGRKPPAVRKRAAGKRTVRDIDHPKNEIECLKRELGESSQREIAVAEILQIINDSPGQLTPVFDAILDKALRLCQAAFGFLTTYDGERFKLAAQQGVPPALADYLAAGMDQPRPGDAHSRVLAGEDLVHNLDQMDEDAYRLGNPLRRAVVDLGGARSALVVALRKDRLLRGALTIYRKEVRPFSVSQVSLLRHFANHAVIAIENVRLFAEVQSRTEDLRESLHQQTATADVLKIISRSTFDLKTVLQTLVESAARLCEADNGTITRQDQGAFYRAEAFGFSPEFLDVVRRIRVEPSRGSVAGRALLEGKPVHIPDVLADPEYTFTAEIGLDQFRTALGIPMLREGVPIGVLTVSRSDAHPFTDKQIELVTTFADQAAIAIENVRLFESLEARTRELAASLEDLRTAQDRLVQTEKLASLGQLTAGIAHEIKNPLNFVNNFSALSAELLGELDETLARAVLDQKMRGDVGELTAMLKSNLEKVVQHGKRADSIVKNMLLHSREGSGERRSTDINALVGESLNLAYHGARAEKADFSMALKHDLDPEAGALDVYPQEMTRALLNLIANGFYAATRRKVEAGDGAFEPVLSAATRNLGKTVEIRIRDNGAGIPPEVREKMFNPFFTTKPTGEGTGLGLSMTHDIVVKQHSGRIDVETEPGEFTEFIISLPRDNGTIVGKKSE